MRFSFLFLTALCGLGCVTVTDPSSSGGERLGGTEDAACAVGANFWLAPASGRLIYESLESDPSAPRYVVYDTTAGERLEVTLGKEARDLCLDGRGPVTATGCWGEDARLYFQGHGVFFVLDPAAPEPTLEAVAEAACTSPPPPPPFQVRQPTPRQAEIVRDDGQLVATYRAEGKATDRVVVEHLTLSPDRRHLAYVVAELQGSFASPARGYLLDLETAPDEEPELLAAPVYGPLHWDAAGKAVYGCVGRPGREPRIVRWHP